MIEASPYDAAGYQVLKLETHLHSVHSDGQHTIREMFEACRGAGYAAVALTDHNTQSGISEAVECAAELGLVLVRGVEVTTFRGHAVVLGVSHVPEWRDLETRGMDALADEVHAEGGLVCVAHPAALGSPVCSGCAWEWAISPRSVDMWEIFNGSRPNAEVPLAFWQHLVRDGSTAAPVGAGDVHSIAAAAHAKVAAHVYVRERSTEGVLEALRARRLFSSRGGRIDCWLEAPDGTVVLAGEHASGTRWRARACGEGHLSIKEVDGRAVYAEKRDAHGVLVGASAPIWIDSSH